MRRLLQVFGGGRGGGRLSASELLEELRYQRRRHEAVGRLIDALQAARDAGVDLALVRCRGCPLDAALPARPRRVA